MFLTLGLLSRKKPLVYGVTTSSFLEAMNWYWTPGTVSPPAFRLLRKSEFSRNWKQDKQTGSRILVRTSTMKGATLVKRKS